MHEINENIVVVHDLLGIVLRIGDSYLRIYNFKIPWDSISYVCIKYIRYIYMIIYTFIYICLCIYMYCTYAHVFCTTRPLKIDSTKACIMYAGY